MPKATRRKPASRYEEFRRQAHRLAAGLAKEIREGEAELERLRADLARLLGVIGKRIGAAVDEYRTKSGGRTNWRQALLKLPREFKAADVRKIRGLANKRSSEIFAGITRWIDAGMVKRKTRGIYQRVK